MKILECPAWRRDRPLWAEMVGAPKRPWVAWSGRDAGIHRTVAVFDTTSAMAGAGAYMLGDGVVEADYLGEYDGEPAWYLESMESFLFHSASLGKWVLKDDFLEPVCWERTLLRDGGTEEDVWYGDTWYEANSLAIDSSTGNTSFECAGADAENAREAGQAAPNPVEIAIGGPAWHGAAVCGRYNAVAGTGAGAAAYVGFWSWTVDGGPVWAMDPGKVTEILSAATGAAVPCPGGAWEVRLGAGGAWVADLYEAEREGDLQPKWVPAAGEEGSDNPDVSTPNITWNGLVALPAPDPVYVYQPSRFL